MATDPRALGYEKGPNLKIKMIEAGTQKVHMIKMMKLYKKNLQIQREKQTAKHNKAFRTLNRRGQRRICNEDMKNINKQFKKIKEEITQKRNPS